LKTIRVATYNIHRCQGLDGRVKPGRILEVLSEIEADVVALQEVVSIDNGSPEAEQARFFAEELGLHYCLGPTRPHKGGLYGNVILSRFPLGGAANYSLSVRRREPRGCLRADVSLNGSGVLHVFNVHLGTAFLERRHQARKLLTPSILANEGLVGSRIVLGDFNEWTRGLTTRLLSGHLRSADIRNHLRRSRTYPGVLPLMHLDHIYFDHSLEMVSLKLHRSRKALVASDHLPLYGDFRLAGSKVRN
jgi:endonuclease/exonuclease/phosphatase family metal-dependent hydrolase